LNYSLNCGITYKRIEEVESTTKRQKRQTKLNARRDGHRKKNTGRQDSTYEYETDSTIDATTSIDDSSEDDSEAEDEIMGYSRVRLACKPSVIWNHADSCPELEISSDGLEVEAIGDRDDNGVKPIENEDGIDLWFGWSVRATFPLFWKNHPSTFSYFEIKIIEDGGTNR
jgi:hypothetical protein